MAWYEYSLYKSNMTYSISRHIVFFFPGMLSATASLGLILLWDVDGGLTQIDKYLYSSEDFIKVCFISNIIYCSGYEIAKIIQILKFLHLQYVNCIFIVIKCTLR